MSTERTDQWTFGLYSGQAGLANLHAEWRAMVVQTPAAGYLHTPEWLGAYLHSFATNANRVVCIAARHAGQLRGVFTFESVRQGLPPLGLNTLRLIKNDHMHLADCASADAGSGVWTALLAWMARQRDLKWDLMWTQGVAEDSTLGRWISVTEPTPRISDARHATAWLDCSQGIEQALGGVTRSHRQNVRRLMRRAEQSGELRYDIITTPEALPAALQQFLEVESSGWKGDAGSAILRDPQLVAFYRELIDRFGPLGQCRINLLKLGDETIAAQFGLVTARQLNLLKIGYRPEHSQVAPGNLIMHKTIESVCDDPQLDRLSLVTNPPWAHLWKPQLTPVQRHILFRPGLRGAVIHKLLQRAFAHRHRAEEASHAAPASSPDLSTSPQS
ncbi:MAG: GNAT family N-acetyltransferase [Burkholderiales bacterium]